MINSSGPLSTNQYTQYIDLMIIINNQNNWSVGFKRKFIIIIFENIMLLIMFWLSFNTYIHNITYMVSIPTIVSLYIQSVNIN